jgi:GxxExxY protein
MVEPEGELDASARRIVDVAFNLPRAIGPGLLESDYETLLAKKLELAGFNVQRQVVIDAVVYGISLPAAFRIDILIDTRIVIEVKSVEKSLPVHPKQLMTYLTLGNFPLGFVINFGTALFKDGIYRRINSNALLATSRLGGNQNTPNA